ncbi:MAG TPA: tetratricopeptide repeat protein [Bryobacteraceae bacterium]|nr:tetratricopeptide repeat protein [Bryobacteraceae bacterium]
MRGLLLIFAGMALGQTAGSEYATLEKAYTALRAKDYDNAIALFRQAIAISPDRASIRTDLAYTLLKTGDTEEARDQFAEAMKLEPGNDHVALEYAFLCYETKQTAIARRIFDRIRKTGNATAAQAFENIDRPLREGIERWTKAVELEPQNFSAHEELAKLADQRDDLALAAEHYEKAWRLRPARRDLLLDLGRVWRAQGRKDDAMSALLAASRGGEPRVAEQARELLPARYPYVYEFENALKLDPSNVELRRELAFLHLEMKNGEKAETQFETIVAAHPDDLLSTAQLGLLRLSRGDGEGARPLLERVLAGKDDELADRVRAALRMPQVLHPRPEEPRAAVAEQAKDLANKSLEKGYLKDAIRYLEAAHENDPLDFDVILKLGRTYNILKDDQDAVRWFDLARRSPAPQNAAEATRAYNNLHPQFDLLRTTFWISPTFSTRWHDLFAYAQAKTELRLPHWWLHPYASVRFIGDTQGVVNVADFGPQALSEQSAILGLGVSTDAWHGATGWFEAGESLRYAPTQTDPGRVVPDYRGGVSYGKGWGNLLAAGRHGLFAETNDDGIYVSRFDHDTLLYSQNRTGYTFRGLEAGGLHAQIYWNWNVTADALRQYWANYAETGPGIKFRFESLRAPLTFSVNAVRGAYLVNQGNPRGPNFNDVRVGIWYAFTK